MRKDDRFDKNQDDIKIIEQFKTKISKPTFSFEGGMILRLIKDEISKNAVRSFYKPVLSYKLGLVFFAHASRIKNNEDDFQTALTLFTQEYPVTKVLKSIYSIADSIEILNLMEPLLLDPVFAKNRLVLGKSYTLLVHELSIGFNLYLTVVMDEQRAVYKREYSGLLKQFYKKNPDFNTNRELRDLILVRWKDEVFKSFEAILTSAMKHLMNSSVLDPYDTSYLARSIVVSLAGLVRKNQANRNMSLRVAIETNVVIELIQKILVDYPKLFDVSINKTLSGLKKFEIEQVNLNWSISQLAIHEYAKSSENELFLPVVGFVALAYLYSEMQYENLSWRARFLYAFAMAMVPTFFVKHEMDDLDKPQKFAQVECDHLSTLVKTPLVNHRLSSDFELKLKAYRASGSFDKRIGEVDDSLSGEKNTDSFFQALMILDSLSKRTMSDHERDMFVDRVGRLIEYGKRGIKFLVYSDLVVTFKLIENLMKSDFLVDVKSALHALGGDFLLHSITSRDQLKYIFENHLASLVFSNLKIADPEYIVKLGASVQADQLKPIVHFLNHDTVIVHSEALRREYVSLFAESLFAYLPPVSQSHRTRLHVAILYNIGYESTLKISHALESNLIQEQVDLLKKIKLLDLDDLSREVKYDERMLVNLQGNTLYFGLMLLIAFLNILSMTFLSNPESILDPQVISFGIAMAMFFNRILKPVDAHELYHSFSQNRDPDDTAWLNEFKEKPVIEHEPVVEVVAPKPPTQVKLKTDQTSSSRVQKKIIDRTGMQESRIKILNKAYHNFVEKIRSESYIADRLFNTKNGEKKQGLKQVVDAMHAEADEFFGTDNTELKQVSLEAYLIIQWNKLLTPGEGQITRDIQLDEQLPPPPPPAPPPPPEPAPQLLQPPVPQGVAVMPIASSSSAKPFTPAQDANQIHHRRVETLWRWYGPQSTAPEYTQSSYLAVKFDLLELCERLNTIDAAKYAHLKSVRHGLLHHDAAMDEEEKFKTYLSVLQNFGANKDRTYIDFEKDPILGHFKAQQVVRKNEGLEGAPRFTPNRAQFKAACHCIVFYYHQYEAALQNRSDYQTPRKAMLMSVIELGGFMTHLISGHYDVSNFMSMNDAIVLTDFRKNFCHLDSMSTEGGIQNGLTKIFTLIGKYVDDSSVTSLSYSVQQNNNNNVMY